VSKEERSGDICNPCVLKVKRFNMLPKGSDKNWFDTVDSKKTTSYTVMKVNKHSYFKSNFKRFQHAIANAHRFQYFQSPCPSTSGTPTSSMSRPTVDRSPKKNKKQLFQSSAENPLAVSPIKKKHFYVSKRMKMISSPVRTERKQQNPRKIDLGALPRPLPFPGFFDPNIWNRQVTLL
jgi:hypothetical protein